MSQKEYIKQLFSKHQKELCFFERETHRFSNRPDLNALMILDILQPNIFNIIKAFKNKEVFLFVDLDTLVITEEQVISLLRSGVNYDSEYDSLRLFV